MLLILCIGMKFFMDIKMYLMLCLLGLLLFHFFLPYIYFLSKEKSNKWPLAKFQQPKVFLPDKNFQNFKLQKG